MKYKLLTLFTLSALGSGIVARPAVAAADATYQNYPAVACTSNSIDYNWSGAASFNDFGQAYNGNSGGFSKLFCPVVSTPGVGVSASISFWSNGMNAPDRSGDSFSVSLSLCNISAGGGGGTCIGAPPYTGGSGNYSLSTTDLVPFAGDYYFLDVFLGPTSSSGSENVLFGYNVKSGS